MSNTFRRTNYKFASSIGQTDVWQLKGSSKADVCFYESALTVDADGAPNAYAPHGTPGTLDNLGNAGKPGHWYGVVTDNGKGTGNPIVQDGVAPKQPYKKFYISPTSLHDCLYPASDVRRYVDATRYPYLALPPQHVKAFGVTIGDFALVINAKTGKFTYAIFGDCKSDKPNYVKVGEFSIATCAAIGAPTNARNGSLPNGIISILFPNSGQGQGQICRPEMIQASGRLSMKGFSSRDKNKELINAFPEFPQFATALTNAGY